MVPPVRRENSPIAIPARAIMKALEKPLASVATTDCRTSNHTTPGGDHGRHIDKRNIPRCRNRGPASDTERLGGRLRGCVVLWFAILVGNGGFRHRVAYWRCISGSPPSGSPTDRGLDMPRRRGRAFLAPAASCGLHSGCVLSSPRCSWRNAHRITCWLVFPPSGVCLNMTAQVIAESTITCPSCGTAKMETMPTNACQFFYECTGCRTLLRPKPGDCCVYCSFGTVPCPPIQAAGDKTGCCG